jgi:hypothetical protein
MYLSGCLTGYARGIVALVNSAGQVEDLSTVSDDDTFDYIHLTPLA